jgi:hypothetical protein
MQGWHLSLSQTSSKFSEHIFPKMSIAPFRISQFKWPITRKKNSNGPSLTEKNRPGFIDHSTKT